MNDSRYTILLAEEDRGCREYLTGNLDADGYEVLAACSREQALVLLCERTVHLLLIDVNGQTLELLDAVRGGHGVAGRVNPDVPIVVLSGRASELERARCLDRGADDIVAKPFFYPELRARLAAILRRAYDDQRRSVLRVGPLTIDLAAHTVDIAGTPVGLSRLEFDLLRTLASDPGRVFTREELFRSIWRLDGRQRTRTLDSHCFRLRKKLAAAGAPGLVVCVWGVGYRLTALHPVGAVA